MLILFAMVSAYLACCIAPRLLVEAVATVIGVLFVIANRRARQKLLEIARPAQRADWDRRPRRPERRALQHGLNAALDKTVFTSLLPHIAVRAHRFARR